MKPSESFEFILYTVVMLWGSALWNVYVLDSQDPIADTFMMFVVCMMLYPLYKIITDKGPK